MRQKMVDPRMRVAGGGLRDLVNPINEHGLDNMSTGYPEARTMLEGHPIHPTTPRNIDLKYLRRFRRVRLTHNVVNGFINSYCHIIHNEENCLDIGRRQKKVMEQMLVKQFLPWISDNLVECLDEDGWPLEMILFQALDNLLADKFLKIHSGSCCQAIAQCYHRIKEMREWVDSL